MTEIIKIPYKRNQQLNENDWVLLFKVDFGYQFGFGEIPDKDVESNYKKGWGKVLRVDSRSEDPKDSKYRVRFFVRKNANTWFMYDFGGFPGEDLALILEERSKIEAKDFINE